MGGRLGLARSCASALGTTAREPLNASRLGQRFLSPGPREPRHRKAVWARAVRTHTSNVCSRGAAFPETPPLHAPKRGEAGAREREAPTEPISHTAGCSRRSARPTRGKAARDEQPP